jgi:hypothetical protein
MIDKKTQKQTTNSPAVIPVGILKVNLFWVTFLLKRRGNITGSLQKENPWVGCL